MELHCASWQERRGRQSAGDGIRRMAVKLTSASLGEQEDRFLLLCATDYGRTKDKLSLSDRPNRIGSSEKQRKTTSECLQKWRRSFVHETSSSFPSPPPALALALSV